MNDRSILQVARELAGPTAPTCLVCLEPVFGDHNPTECFVDNLKLAIARRDAAPKDGAR